jgi:hypothetical protein
VFQQKNCPFKIGEKRQFEIHPKRRDKKEKRERRHRQNEGHKENCIEERKTDIKKMV